MSNLKLFLSFMGYSLGMLLLFSIVIFGIIYGFKVLHQTVFYKPRHAENTSKKTMIQDKIIGGLFTLVIWFATLSILKAGWHLVVEVVFPKILGV